MSKVILSIVVPYHNESPQEIHYLMQSLNDQVGIDFNEIEIILSCDLKKAPLDTYSFNEYPNISSRIRKIKSKYKANPGMSRQAGINVAKGTHVFFCDADDSLFNYGVLRELLDNIKTTSADIYRYQFLEEIGSEGSSHREYVLKTYNWVWVFAKTYKVSFLKQHTIKFSPTLRWHEDTYFNLLCRYSNPSVVDIKSSIAYLWRYTSSSITRINNHEYSFYANMDYFKAVTEAFRVIRAWGLDCSADIIAVIVFEYMNLNNPRWFDMDFNKRVQIEKQFLDFLKEFAPVLLENIPPEVKTRMVDLIYSSGEHFLPDISIEKYIEHLKSLEVTDGINI